MTPFINTHIDHMTPYINALIDYMIPYINTLIDHILVDQITYIHTVELLLIVQMM